jgi:hypothetical protein
MKPLWLLCVALLPVVAQAQFTFVTNSGAITITGYTGSGGAVVIPDTTNGLPVNAVGNGAFYQCTNLTSVTIPGSVTSIGHGAFAFCGSLTGILMPDSVTNFGALTFFACSNLAAATISTNVTSIGASAFDSCTGLTNVNIPNGVINIGGSAFQNCAALAGVMIPNGVTNIGSSAFQNCAGLTNITIPASVIKVGQDAFGACGSLLAISVDPQNTNYGSLDGILLYVRNHSLVQCPGGRTGSYTIPNTISSIGNSAFDSCAALTNIFGIGGDIGDWAFAGCSGLTTVTIPILGAYAFESCSNLTSVTISYYDNMTHSFYHPFDGCTSLTNVTIYNARNEFGPNRDRAPIFSDCPNLTSICLAGNKPVFVWIPTNQIATAYYLPGADPSSISNIPTALWLPRIQNSDASFGLQANQFGFNINWADGMTVLVEACADLANPVWTPLITNTIAGTFPSDSIYFSDPQWTNYPNRFYRVRGLNVPQQ